MKIKLFIVCCLIGLVGCQTPADVIQSHKYERMAVDAYHKDVENLLNALLADLKLAWLKQIEKVIDYEIALRSKDKKIDTDTLTKLLTQQRKKLVEIEDKLKELEAKIKKALINLEIYRKIHDKNQDYLNRKGISAEDQQRLQNEAATIIRDLQKN